MWAAAVQGDGFAPLWYTQSSCVLAVPLLVPATLERTQKSVPEKEGRKRKEGKEGQLNQTDSRRKALLWAFCLGQQDRNQTVFVIQAMSRGNKNNLCDSAQRSIQCSLLSDLALAGLVAGTQIILELTLAQTMQQSNHTEGAQEHATPSTAGKNEVASLAWHLGRRDNIPAESLVKSSSKPTERRQSLYEHQFNKSAYEKGEGREFTVDKSWLAKAFVLPKSKSDGAHCNIYFCKQAIDITWQLEINNGDFPLPRERQRWPTARWPGEPRMQNGSQTCFDAHTQQLTCSCSDINDPEALLTVLNWMSRASCELIASFFRRFASLRILNDKEIK